MFWDKTGPHSMNNYCNHTLQKAIDIIRTYRTVGKVMFYATHISTAERLVKSIVSSVHEVLVLVLQLKNKTNLYVEVDSRVLFFNLCFFLKWNLNVCMYDQNCGNFSNLNGALHYVPKQVYIHMWVALMLLRAWSIVIYVLSSNFYIN